MDLTEAEDIKKRWQEYTEELYKKRKEKLMIIHYYLAGQSFLWGSLLQSILFGLEFPLLFFRNFTL